MPIDYSKYPKDWKTRIVPAIAGRSGGRCEGTKESGYDGFLERCNAPHLKHIRRNEAAPYIWALDEDSLSGYSGPFLCVLTVAHLDHDEENPTPDLSRLAYLCQRCHLNHDRVDNASRAKKKKDDEAGQLRLL